MCEIAISETGAQDLKTDIIIACWVSIRKHIMIYYSTLCKAILCPGDMQGDTMSRGRIYVQRSFCESAHALNK